jgi:hypothetical protein
MHVFDREADFEAFERVMIEARQQLRPCFLYNTGKDLEQSPSAVVVPTRDGRGTASGFRAVSLGERPDILDGTLEDDPAPVAR